jgi:Domain of unknown function (DUF4351)
MQIVTSWMEQGIEQGEHKEAARLVLRVLDRRVGELDANVVTQLQELSVIKLENLLDAALDFQRMDELSAWLDAHQ